MKIENANESNFVPAYLLYVGEGGWSVSDTAYIVGNDGRAKILKDGVKNYILPAEILDCCPDIDFAVSKILSNFSDEEILLKEKSFTEIEDTPQRCCGIDGFEVVLYKIEKNHLKKMWNIDEYGQIPVLNELRDEFHLTRAKKL